MNFSKRHRLVIATLLVVIGYVSAQDRTGYGGNQGLGMGTVGLTDSGAIGIDPTEYLTTWNFNNLPKGGVSISNV